MALSIKHPDAERLARELAARTGEGITEAVLNALRERLERLGICRALARRTTTDGLGEVQTRRNHGVIFLERRMPVGLSARLLEIGRDCANLPELDRRSVDEILDYGSDGLPR